jgi:hypothetical protein
VLAGQRITEWREQATPCAAGRGDRSLSCRRPGPVRPRRRRPAVPARRAGLTGAAHHRRGGGGVPSRRAGLPGAGHHRQADPGDRPASTCRTERTAGMGRCFAGCVGGARRWVGGVGRQALEPQNWDRAGDLTTVRVTQLDRAAASTGSPIALPAIELLPYLAYQAWRRVPKPAGAASETALLRP